MHLKRLELVGFKSFAQRTRIEFGAGLSAVVGPNGCGKSNVVDAIRWVLGEQSVRSLRGSRMEDVIFAGTDRRSPLGYAEVALTLDNDSESLPLPYKEVTVTRRLFRSGESQFAINQTACRLRDIQELFIDTGLSKASYALIGQGQLDSILSANPLDRRILLDEAAGINKYKLKKEQAHHRLAQTNEDLGKIEALLIELKEQLGPLQARADRARRYLELRSRLRQAEETLALWRWHRLKEKEEELSSRLEVHQGRLDQTIAASQEAERDRQVIQKEAKELEQLLAEKARNLEQQQAAANDLRAQIRLIGGELELLQRELAANESDQEELDAKEQGLAAAIGQQQSRVEEAQIALTAARSRFQDLEQRESTTRHGLSTARSQLEQMRSELIDVLQEEVGLRNDEQNLNKEIARLQEAAANLTDELDSLKDYASALEEERCRVEGSVQDARTTLGDLERKGEETQGKLTALQSRSQGLQGEMGALERSIQERKARLRALQDMERTYQGYFLGSRTVLQHQERWPGVYGPVAHLIQVPAEYEKAIAIALGSGLQNIITSTEEVALTVVRFLKARKGGRATFLPLDTIRPQRLAQTDVRHLSAPGVIGVASELVGFDPLFRPAVEYLLGRCILTTDLESAANLARKLRSYHRIITLDGDFISPGGAITGGSSRGGDASLLGRRRQLEELRAFLAEKEGQLREMEQEHAQLAEQQAAYERELRDLEQQRHQMELELTRRIKELDGLDPQQSRLADQIQALSAQQDKLVVAIKENMDELASLQAKHDQCKTRRDHLEGEVKRLQGTILELEQSSRTDEQDLRAAQVAVASRQAALEREVERLRELQSALLELEELKKVRQTRLLELENRQERGRQSLHQGQERLLELEQAIKAQEGQIGTLKVELEEKNRLIGELTMQLERFRQQRGILETKVNGLTLELEKTLWRKNEETKLLASLGVEDPLDCSIEEPHPGLQAEVAELQRQLDELGPVDPQTIPEAEALAERCGFLNRQYRDLVSAREDLEKLVATIDRDSRTRFLETFGEIRREFRELFAQLFEGGKADLELLEPDQPLESGIEITAHLPGKKTQSLALLSGGERALTAIGLLFALLKVRPSPFCLLDEIDAALDEANLDRYIKVLQDYARSHQVIVISHRPKVMEAADSLLGVTMPEKGVSQVISLRLAQAAY
ncbi:MAG: chromosome segregation protein SMC [Limnochordia bacterium]